MKIEKILNNNFAIVSDEGREQIVMGLGIAFQKKVGDKIQDYEVDKIFRLSTSALNLRLQEVLVDVPMPVVQVSEKIITFIKLEIGKKVNDLIYVTLIDHVNSALMRSKEGISVANGLLLDIQRFYPVEYLLGLEAVQMINTSFSVSLQEDEAGFIALHIVNATMNDTDNSISMQITQLMKEILSLVRRFFRIDFDTNSLYYYRFVNHLRYFGQRMFTEDASISQEKYDELLTMIKAKYVLSYQCAVKIEQYLYEQYTTTISSEELMYLTIHIERIVDESKKNKENQHE